MPDPTVTCVMLANGRPEMVARAVRAFRAQTYGNARLIMRDTGCEPLLTGADPPNCIYSHHPYQCGLTIGRLRNETNVTTDADIIVHWDSDDWSHPNRIAEQVALLQASGAECVGYREMLFWRRCDPYLGAVKDSEAGSAWLYSNPLDRNILGTSLCYWRKIWEDHPFPDTSQGEDTKWLLGLRNVKGVPSIREPEATEFTTQERAWLAQGNPLYEPRMIANIHGGNTCARIDPAAREWRRVPEWDEHCRRIMEGINAG